ncbi:hypothetical protein V6N13_065582 [Hibiscus sabdariffa]|uniref:Uncharacterized protein n=1 Tax=Hibiscus sabdariffa TaxID=183260 RepID=A0ABR2QQE6_9ROSI
MPAFTLFGTGAIAKQALLPALVCKKLFSIGNVIDKPSKCNVIRGACASAVASKHVSNTPIVVNGPFTCFTNSSRIAL